MGGKRKRKVFKALKDQTIENLNRVLGTLHVGGERIVCTKLKHFITYSSETAGYL